MNTENQFEQISQKNSQFVTSSSIRQDENDFLAQIVEAVGKLSGAMNAAQQASYSTNYGRDECAKFANARAVAMVHVADLYLAIDRLVTCLGLQLHEFMFTTNENICTFDNLALWIDLDQREIETTGYTEMVIRLSRYGLSLINQATDSQPELINPGFQHTVEAMVILCGQIAKKFTFGLKSAIDMRLGYLSRSSSKEVKLQELI